VPDVVERVVHPAHVPLEPEAEPAHVRGPRDARPRGGLLGDRDDAGVVLVDRRVHLLQEGDGVEVLAAAVDVRQPLPVRPGQKELSEADALAKAQDIRKKIEGGADFAELARTESDDTSSGAIGGDLGFFGRNQMVPPFEEAAFAMKDGELSQPVKTPFGFHIIKVDARESKSLDEMKPELEKRLRPDMAGKALENLQKNSSVLFDPEFFGTAPAPSPAPAAPGK